MRIEKKALHNHVGHRLPRVFVISLILGLCTPHTGYSEIYKYVENGVVHYTNSQPDNASYQIFKDDSKTFAPNPKKTTTSKSSRKKKTPYLNIIHKVSKAHDLSPELVKAIVKVESNYNHEAVSPKGAQGLMQLMPAIAKRFGVNDTFDPEENITGGVKFLRHLFNKFGEENLDLVLACYNAGEEAVRKYGNKVPPYSETQKYVKKVKALYLVHSPYKTTKSQKIFKYVDKNGVLAFTNVQRIN